MSTRSLVDRKLLYQFCDVIRTSSYPGEEGKNIYANDFIPGIIDHIAYREHDAIYSLEFIEFVLSIISTIRTAFYISGKRNAQRKLLQDVMSVFKTIDTRYRAEYGEYIDAWYVQQYTQWKAFLPKTTPNAPPPYEDPPPYDSS